MNRDVREKRREETVRERRGIEREKKKKRRGHGREKQEIQEQERKRTRGVTEGNKKEESEATNHPQKSCSCHCCIADYCGSDRRERPSRDRRMALTPQHPARVRHLDTPNTAIQSIVFSTVVQLVQ
ncbi:hypothetical protein [Halorubrum sp. FL23]|uniref:hypothetical protein n=1 Tax=Halorubrum sp. FL23 TaxID=3458704 RepID=UPI004033CC50